MTIGFIGGGNMASALISGFISSGKVSADNIIVFDTDAEKLSAMAENMGISPASSASDTECRADIVVLAVKPNVMPFVLNELSGTDGKIYVSIAAGITLDTLEGSIGSGKKIIRTMPNTPALVGCGITVITPNKNVAPDELSSVEELFKAVGETVILDEKYINPAIALHSSSPAYI